MELFGRKKILDLNSQAVSAIYLACNSSYAVIILQFLRRLGIKDSEGDCFSSFGWAWVRSLPGLILELRVLHGAYAVNSRSAPSSLVFCSVLFEDPLLFSGLPFLFLSILVLNSTSFVVWNSDNYFPLATCFFFLFLTLGIAYFVLPSFGSCRFSFSVLRTALDAGCKPPPPHALP